MSVWRADLKREQGSVDRMECDNLSYSSSASANFEIRR